MHINLAKHKNHTVLLPFLSVPQGLSSDLYSVCISVKETDLDIGADNSIQNRKYER